MPGRGRAPASEEAAVASAAVAASAPEVLGDVDDVVVHTATSPLMASEQERVGLFCSGAHASQILKRLEPPDK